MMLRVTLLLVFSTIGAMAPPRKATLAQQKMCAEQAGTVFHREYPDATSADSYLSHYDPDANHKCPSAYADRKDCVDLARRINRSVGSTKVIFAAANTNKTNTVPSVVCEPIRFGRTTRCNRAGMRAEDQEECRTGSRHPPAGRTPRDAQAAPGKRRRGQRIH